MRSLNIVSQYGHLYDRETGRRLELVPDSEYYIIGDSDRAFKYYTLEQEPNLRKEEVIIASIENEPGFDTHKKVLEANSTLYFRLFDPFAGEQHKFRVVLLEPLFIYSKKHWVTRKDGRKGALYDCHCKLEENLGGSLRFFDQLYAKSLNEMYKKSFVHYFGNKGNPACNAFEKFFTDPFFRVIIDGLRDF